MNRTTLIIFSLLISSLSFDIVAAQQPTNAQDVAAELSRKANEGGRPHCTTVEASAYNKMSAHTDYLN